MSAKKPFYPRRSKVPNLRSQICFSLRMKRCLACPSMTLKKSPTMWLRCNMVSVVSKEDFPFRCGSFERFTQSCYVADGERTKHRANFVAHRIGLAAAAPAMLHSFRLLQNE